jgi:hypothetical protein
MIKQRYTFWERLFGLVSSGGLYARRGKRLFAGLAVAKLISVKMSMYLQVSRLSLQQDSLSVNVGALVGFDIHQR